MSELPDTPAAYGFDDVVVDRENFRVLKAGEPRRITPRAFEVPYQVEIATDVATAQSKIEAGGKVLGEFAAEGSEEANAAQTAQEKGSGRVDIGPTAEGQSNGSGEGAETIGDTGADFALVMPKANTKAMIRFLDDFSKTLAPDVQVLLVMDQAGWHRAKDLVIPTNITAVSLPPYSPELNPVERVWLHLRERFLSHRWLEDYDAIVQACCQAWNAMVADPERLRSITSYPWIPCVNH